MSTALGQEPLRESHLIIVTCLAGVYFLLGCALDLLHNDGQCHLAEGLQVRPLPQSKQGTHRDSRVSTVSSAAALPGGVQQVALHPAGSRPAGPRSRGGTPVTGKSGSGFSRTLSCSPGEEGPSSGVSKSRGLAETMATFPDAQCLILHGCSRSVALFY